MRDFDSEYLFIEIKVIIFIQLKNDEKLVYMVDKVFCVVQNGQCLWILVDFCYYDFDLGFDDG